MKGSRITIYLAGLMAEVTSMRTSGLLLSALISVCLTVSMAPAAEEAGAETSATVSAVLELNQSIYYAGAPLELRLSIVNHGDETVTNPVKIPLFKGLRVRDASGDLLGAKGRPTAREPQRPTELSANGFYGVIVDLSEIYTQLETPGRYEISWEGKGIRSPTIMINLIPEYDPAKTYIANIETSEGTIVMDFFARESPVAVKAFVDMANAGFYDGLLIHEVHPDDFIVSGDPRFGGTGAKPIVYPAEQSRIPIVSGTVVLKPVGAAPPANSSPFVIIIRPRPEWAGQVTVLGQVVSGLDIVKKISKLPSTQQSSSPQFKPLKDVPIRRIVIEEKMESKTAH